jgi:hypothetical protein
MRRRFPPLMCAAAVTTLVSMSATISGSGQTSTARTEAVSGTRSSTVRALAGTWKLVSWVRHTADGRVLPYEPVLGLLFYDQFGNMSVQIRAEDPTNEGRPPAASTGAQGSSERYVAYFGTYVDEGKRAVTHHIRGNRSQATGIDAVRVFELQGNQLTLRAQADGMTHALVWHRAR